MIMVDVSEIQYHESIIRIHLTEEQAIMLVAAIELNMKKVKGDCKGIELMTILKLVENKIRVGLWKEGDESSD